MENKKNIIYKYKRHKFVVYIKMYPYIDEYDRCRVNKAYVKYGKFNRWKRNFDIAGKTINDANEIKELANDLIRDRLDEYKTERKIKRLKEGLYS